MVRQHKKQKNQRQRQSIRNTKDDKDRISELPIHVFLRILEFMNTRDAVRLCALSKSWKDFWKRLTTLSFDSWESSIVNFEKFVSEVLSGRDGSIPLLNLEIILRTDLEQLDDIYPEIWRVSQHPAIENLSFCEP